MFEKITPEEAGISSKTVKKFISALEKRGAATHGLIFMRGDKTFAEAYWKPFNKDFPHRQYSQTKSFVGVAIGLLEEEGKLSLDDKIVDFFPEKLDGEPNPFLKAQTVRDMLTMKTVGRSSSWFISGDKDRTHHYLNEKRKFHSPGTVWAYDSPGTQVLCNLVEKLAGKSLLDYLKEKLFDKMGAFKSATVLKTPNGVSWGDSAMICPLRDMAAFGRLLMNKGVWNGERLMNEKYITDATSDLVDNCDGTQYSAYRQGYGYQIWRVAGGGFSFVGMGDQLTVCYPEKDLLFAVNSDNTSNPLIREMIYRMLEDEFVDEIKDEPLKEDKGAQKELADLISSLTLRAVKGEEDSPLRQKIDGVKFICEENPMGIKEFSFKFTGKDKGEFRYTNAQGDKVLRFGINRNEFGKFPQEGYSDEFGALPTTNGFLYDAAVSAAWSRDSEIVLFTQIIDKYFGHMSARFAFNGDHVSAVFKRFAENFLNEYNGELIGKKSV